MPNALRIALLVAVFAWPLASHAQVPLAQSLFEEGRTLMAQGKTSEACPRFAESLRLDRRSVTLLNLAACHRAEGKTASAWVEFRQAEALAQREGSTARATEAKTQGEQVHAELSYITFQASWSRPGESVLLDGNAVGRALWSSALPVDPGKHIVRVTAEGAKAYELSIEIQPGASTTPVSLPEPQALPESSAAAANEPAPAPSVVAPPPVSPVPPPPAASDTTRTTLGFALGGAGLVAVGVGAAFGFAAISKNAHKNDLCPNDVCADAGTKDDASRSLSIAHTNATVSTLAFVVGGALLVGGAVLLLTKPQGAANAARLTVSALSTGAAF